jgi:methyltransferase (TIGR00027 family)
LTTELPSRTSIWAAAARAVGASSPAPFTNPDTLAASLLGQEELALLDGHPLADAITGSAEAREAPDTRGAMFTLLVRTRFIDDKLTRAIEAGAKQVVIMGAGFDSRAYRLQELLAGVRVFEVDRPSTQGWKRRRVQAAIGEPPPNLTYASIDFRHEALGDVLARAGYDASLPTFFIWEGVTMYLTEEVVRATLSWIAQQAPGSSLVFDFTARHVIDLIETGEAKTEFERLFLQRNRMIAAWGEPWIFGIPEDAVPEFLSSVGLTTREVLAFASPEAIRRYVGPVAEGRALPIRPSYYLAEAAVS